MSNARATTAALLAILVSGLVSAYWAFHVPIFQAPDEPAHFDYAISIYNAHRLVRLSDGKPGWIVSPYTNYLLRASDFERIAWHSSMRVPAGYGTQSFFSHLDSNAPNLHTPLAPTGEINYIVPTYPFGFYALEAVWMHTVALFTGSIVTVFFAARLLCVLLTMAALGFNYWTAIRLGLPRWASVALVAAIGLLPLTSFVSSYIQPDNLAYALVSAALFFAVTLRRNRSPVTLCGLALSLGFLAVTKYQFFLATAVPSLALVALSLRNGRRSGWLSALRVGAVLLPSLALLSVQRFYVDASSTRGVLLTPSHSDYLLNIAALGARPLFAYLAANTVGAFSECFNTGLCAATFWQVVGWFDTPIVIVSANVERIMRVIISLASIVTAILVAYLVARNFSRLLACAVRGHWRAALRAAAGDSVLNSYLLFVGLILVLYLMTNNSFAIEGRHWYPFIFASFLCFVWYAPRALGRRKTAIPTALAITLLAYSLLASGYAAASVSQRYYGPQTTGFVSEYPLGRVVPGSAGVLWSVVDARYHAVSETPFSYSPGTRLLASGGVFPSEGRFPTVTSVVLDQRVAIPVLSNQYHLRVGEAAHDFRNGYDAFYAFLSTRGLRDGPHLVTAYAQVPGRNAFQSIFPARVFFITENDGSLPPSIMRVLAKAPILGGEMAAAGVCKGTALLDRGDVSARPGAALLFAGRIDRAANLQPIAVWFLVNSRPVPGRLASGGGSFAGIVPTVDLAPGLYRVAAYAILKGAPRPVRIGGVARFRIVPGKPGAGLQPRAPAACSDPFGQLAQV
ncbi:MAG TPA: DUF2142 domain-containing protein [Candidatus Cybelea sp.]